MTARAANIIHEFYVPLPETQVKTALVSIEPASGIVGNTLESVISIVATGAGTVVHYDQWEDGYEVDLNNPSQSSTQIWGDGNNSNGIPPGYANDPATFTAGSVIVLRNQVPLPRNPANLLYDGRDRFGGTKALVVSRASWATVPGTVLCGANEVLPTMDYGTQFVSPVGIDVSASSMFEFVGIFVMARDDATSVTIDADGSGSGVPVTFTLNRGESYLMNGGIKKGATVSATKPVQAHLVTGDIGARYESRRFTLYPRDQWSDVTYSPVGTASNGHQAYAFIYNPNAASLTINVTTSIGNASFPVAANAVYQYQLPQNSGAKFMSSSGADFFGVVTVGANPSSNNVNDWGFSMVPSDNLTTEAVVGWGPGSENLTQNGSPVWVTPTSATRVYIDYNGDKAGSLTDPKGGKYDAHLDIGTMESRRVYDPDKDQTAMRLYTLDGITISAAWGQDPAVAGPALPYLDCGTTVLPFPVPTLIKSFSNANDVAPTGLSINDTIEYRIDVDNKGLLPLGNLLVLDPLNASLTYVAGSTKRDGVAIPDGSTGTLFPLDESGYTIPIILRGGTTTFTYRCTINAAGNIANTATNSNYNLVSTASVIVPPPAGSTACGAQFTNAAGVVQSAYTAGALIYATLTDPDANNSTGTVEGITVVIRNTTNGDAEFVTLVETGANTGIFRNTTGLTTSTTTGSSQMDSTLLIAPGNSLSFIYTDPEFNETCTGNAVIAVPTQNKFLYLSDPSQALDRVDPVATIDATTASSATLGLGAGSITVVGAAASSNAGQTVSSHSFSYNSGSTGSNRILMVGISYRDGDDELVSSVTYGGQAMTSVGTQNVDDSTAPDGRIYIFRLYNPPTGANALAVTWNSALDQGAVVGAITYAGVDITGTPLGTFASAAVLTGNPSVNVPSAAGDLIFGVVAGRNAANYTITGGGTSLWAAFPYTGQTAGAAQSKTGVATQTNISFGSGTTGNALLAAIGGVALKAAPAGGTPTATFTQAPTFASTFTMPVGAIPTVTAHYNVVTGSMPTTPAITAVLKKNTTTFATSTSASASTSTGNGLLTLNFGALASATNFAATDYVTLDITTAQSGVTFTVQFDSSTRASKITLPTTTVIDVNALGVYDAPYPAGSLITGLTSGTTAYVRSTVSDPFGHADITSMDLAITGPGGSGNITTALSAANVVTTTTGTKTYEYAWAVGATAGTYNIAVTANEGTEGINATRATTVNVTMLDLGTPSTTEFTTGVNGPGTPTYAGGEIVCVRVTDLDQNTNALVAETVTVTITTASGDSELITLTETGVNTGIFTGSIPASTTLGAGNNSGTLRAVLGELLTVIYVDPTDPTDTSNDTATIPDIAPAVSVNKTLVTPVDGLAVIGEPLQYTVQVANTGNTTLSTIALTDTFPAANLSYVSSSLAPATTGSGTLSWTNVGPLSPGQSLTITLNFTALASAAPAVNSAVANAGGGVTGTDNANVTITRPAHTITKTLFSPNPGPANINANVVFRIVLQNTGDTAIATLPLEDTFSGADFTFVSATLAPDASGSGSLLWNDVTGAGSLAVGASTTIDVTLKAKGAAAPALNLAAASYSVDVNGDTVPAVSSSASITLVAAKITGLVYIDPDQSVTFNAGDSAFGGVTVSLYTDPNSDGNPADGTLVSIATTGTDGVFEFVNLATGTYVIVESQPPGYSSSGDTQGANDNRIALNVSTLTTFANNNFFDYLTPSVSYASIAGKVWNDANANALVTAGEVGIENVPVDLVEDSNGNGLADSGEPVVSSTLTAADGTYAFAGLSAGNYVVVERDLFGWYSTADVAAPNNNMIPVPATAGSNTTGRDFLDVLTGTVGGKVYHDVDGNGAFGGSDTALANIDVIITNSFGVSQTVVTNATGDWTASVPPGSTSVNVDQADAQFTAVFTTGYQQTAGTDPNSISAVSSVNTPAGDDGFRRLGSITGTVLADTNNDDTGDVGINAVTLTLQDGSGNDIDSDTVTGGVQPTTTTTNASGVYTFAGLIQATYRVVETDPAGYFSVTSNTVNPVNVVAGSTTSGINFVDEQAGSITGFVRADTDNNDTGDSPLSGVTLTLKDSSGNDIDSSAAVGIQPTTTTTNASGIYTFANLAPGTYRVVETDLAGYFSVTPNTVTPVVVNAGAVTSNINFVDEQAGSITGFVLADTNNDNTGDVGIVGVTLTLKDSSGNDIDSDTVTSGIQPTTAITIAGGAYSFTNLLPGTYRVVETDPAGYFSVTSNTANPVNVVAGTATANVNFVDEQPGSITGTVRADTNNDDTGDAPLSGVTLTLKDSSGNDIDSDTVTGGIQPTTTTTNASGVYTFANLLPGTYRVLETDLAGYFSVTNNTVSSVNVVAGTITSNINFVDEQAGSITGTVRADTNDNDTGDVPLSGVTLTLKDSSGNDIDSDAVTGGIQPTTTTTNASGIYSFTNLLPGSYRVVETDLVGYFSVTNNTVSPVNVVAGTATANVDFVDEQAGSITGTVLADADNDDDGDTPISGVTLTLKDSSGNDIDSSAAIGIQPTTTTTNASGIYTFANLLPGTYRVVETDLAGYFSVTSNTVASIAVNAGAVTGNVNFIDEQAGSITGTVRADTNNDDTGDVAISSVTLTLKDSSGNDVDSDTVTGGIQPTTTTTNAGGAYTFANLVPGTYRVVETDLSGYFSVTPNTVNPVNVVAGAVTADVNFVDEQAGSITGTVLADTDNDDDGDSAITGVTLTLKDSSGNDIDSDDVTSGVQPTTTTTNASGAYTFADLRPGTYRVVETDPAGYLSITPNTVNPVNVVAGTVTSGIHFVDEELGSITGTVLADTDNDDDGDDPITGVTLSLKDSSGNDIDSDDVTSGVQPTTTTTNASGVYSFLNLTPGTYRVVETDPVGYSSVTPNTVSPVTVVAGAVTMGVDFIDEQAGSITGTVLADLDNDDIGDDPISGVTITLKDGNGDDIDSDLVTSGIQPTTTTTNASGVYTFAGLAPGSYRVVETDPAGYFSVTPNTVSGVNVVAGASTSDVNFVDEEPGSITGSVLADIDNDDSGDEPLDGVTLTLKNGNGDDIDSDLLTSGIQPTTTTTNAGGIFIFTNLAPGSYRVVETDLAGYLSVTPNTVSPVAVVAGTSTTGVNFVDEQTAGISGTVLADIDNDDMGDDPISGVTITLKDSSGNDIDSDLGTPGIQPTTTTTNASGVYSIPNLTPGTYRVLETDPAGYLSVTPNTISPVIVVAGTPTTGIDFVDEQPGSITGTVLADIDNDDIGDDPISGVTITLKDSNGDDIDSDLVSSGIQPTTTTTNASGVYTFADLLPGTYRVVETDLAGHLSVTPNTISPVSVVAGTTTNDINFIDEQVGSISGSVLADLDNDDMGDDPISGVTLTLKDSNGADIDSDLVTSGIQPTTTTTNASGLYTFADLAPGSYRVVETDPMGYLSVSPNTVSPVDVVAGTTTSDIDFVDEQPGSITGTVLADIDNDDNGDDPISGVTLTLKDSNGDDIDSDLVTAGIQPTTTTTNPSGVYTFAGLAPGSYRVVETDLAGYLSVTPNTVNSVSVVAGVATNDINFVDEEVGSISGTVLADIDNDDMGDDPLSGVTLTLKDSNGDDIDSDLVTVGIQPTTTTTDGSGAYGFANLTPGSYRVVETDLPDYLSITPNTVSNVDVLAGADTSDVNFVDEEVGSITGTVLADTDNDDMGDDPISGVTLTLQDSNGDDIDSDLVTAGVQPTTTITDGYGFYLFINLAPGTYRVVETDPSGHISVTSNTVSPVIVVAGTPTNDVNFVDEMTGGISGFVLADTDNDDDGDDPIVGVTLTLKDGSGNDIDGDDITPGVQPKTMITLGNGGYTFGNLAPGTYRVVETDPAGYFSVTPNTVSPVLVTTGTEISNVNFVDEQPGSINGKVLADADNDDDGDDPINGVTVTLKDGNGDDIDSDDITPGVQPTTRTTLGSGDYAFTNLAPGTYRVVETDPAGYFSVTPNTMSPVNVTAGIDTSDVNFVDEQAGTIGGRVLADADNDDDGDDPISGVTLTLKDSSGNDIDSDDVTAGVQPTTTTTNALGYYLFTDLAPGSYRVVETDLAGYFSVTSNTVAPVLVTAGVDTSDVNFVDEQPGSISGTVVADIDNDDNGDDTISGVTLTLKDSNGNDIDSDDITAGIQPTTTVTNGSGFYTFAGLLPGSYRVVETDPAGYLSVTPNTVSSVIVVAGAATSDVSFVDEQSVTLGNLVWNDIDNNGLKDSGEPGIDDVLVELLNGSGASVDGDSITAGVQPTLSTTAGGGFYSFANVAPGSYRLRIAAPPSAYPLSSTTTNTADDQQDDDDNGIQTTVSGTTLSPVIELAAGEVDDTLDFGFTALVGMRTISGQVRDDYDLDGNLSDSDQPVPSVTVRLYADTNDNGVYDDGIDQLVRTTTTNGLGGYSFTGLPDGSYFVQEVDPAGSTSTKDSQGNNDNLIFITLAGSDSLDNDFLDAVDPAGYAYDVVTGEIVAGGGISVSGPPGAGITILLDGSTGQYSFITDGTPGSYTLTYTPPIGYIIDPARPVAGPSLDPTGGPDPYILGSAEDPLNPGFLANSTSVANPYYLTFDLASGDPFVINNNIPLRLSTPRTFKYWKKITGGGPNPGSNGDADCYTDLVEYALNLNAISGVQTSPAFRGVRNTLTGRLDVSFDRVAGGVTDVTYTLMGIGSLSASPAGWTALSRVPTVTANGDGTETVTFANVEGDPYFIGVTQGFVRLLLELDEDGNSVPEASASTPVFGWTRRTLGTECVMTGYPYLKDKNFCGTIDAVVGTTLNVATSVGGSSIVTQFAPGREHFVEIFSGDNTGHRFDIDEAASTATSIALETVSIHNTLTTIPANLAGDKAVIREHHTLNDLFPRTQFAATNDPSTADRVLFYDRTAGGFKIYWLFANLGNPYWVLSDDATLANQSSRIIDPAEGWFTHPKGVQQEVVWHGMVRANAFACPLVAGANFVGSGYPMDQSPAMRGMTTFAGFRGSRDPTKADELLFWKGYTSTQSMAYYNHFLLSSGAIQQWTELGNASLINENNLFMFKPTTGSIYKMRVGLPTYVMPMPWTP